MTTTYTDAHSFHRGADALALRIRKAFGAFDDPNKAIETIARELAERKAAIQPQGGEVSILDDLDFEPDEAHTVADMANIGYSLMQEIARNKPGYVWSNSPAEIVADLINELNDAQPPQHVHGDGGDVRGDADEQAKEIEFLKLELSGFDSIRRELSELVGCSDEPRWKWIYLAVSDLVEKKNAMVRSVSDAEWHAPGIGEVHNKDHSLMIWCSKESPEDGEHIADDELAKTVCAALEAFLKGGE